MLGILVLVVKVCALAGVLLLLWIMTARAPAPAPAPARAPRAGRHARRRAPGLDPTGRLVLRAMTGLFLAGAGAMFAISTADMLRLL